MKQSNLNYAAGFLDADGCITTSHGRTFRVVIANTNKEILIWFKENFGGSINNHYLPKHPNHNEAWKWIISSRADVIKFLKLVQPLLKIKGPQAKAVLDYHSRYIKQTYGRGVRANPERVKDYEDTKDMIRKLKTDLHRSRI